MSDRINNIDILHSDYYRQCTHVTKTSDKVGEDIGKLFGLFGSHVSSHTVSKNQNDSVQTKPKTIKISSIIHKDEPTSVHQTLDDLTGYWVIVVKVVDVQSGKESILIKYGANITFPLVYAHNEKEFGDFIRKFRSEVLSRVRSITFAISEELEFRDRSCRVLVISIVANSNATRGPFLQKCFLSSFKVTMQKLEWRLFTQVKALMAYDSKDSIRDFDLALALHIFEYVFKKESNSAQKWTIYEIN